ncbi:MAG: AAA family ATPase [Planctomycetes bacterium]|nr:AAA family ATPase [Planctomycetota bacterium]MBI3847984.1 AAA family ATPase [Planctomycetota bacterium]
MTATLPPFVEDLLDPAAHRVPTRRVDLVQTHISYVLLTDDRVYKIKKPVRLPFLDFSTVEKRRHFCEEEVRLNRRISPSVYLGVRPIVATRTGHRFGRRPRGAVDFAVEMVRLPDADNAVTRLRDGRLEEGDVDRFAALVARFHSSARRGTEVDAYATNDAVAALVRGNLAEMTPFAGRELPREAFDAVRAWTEDRIRALDGAFARRVGEGRACDGHGDLQLGHFFVHGASRTVSVIDCIEFNEGFRCADAAADVAFLAMDLDRLGRHDLASRFANQYADFAADHDLFEVLDFYVAYRALVRAKVACLKSREVEVADADREAARRDAAQFLSLAARYATPAPRERALILVLGPVGCGKTTVAWELSHRLGAPVVSSDVVRKAIAGVSRTKRASNAAYLPDMTERVYARLRDLAAAILRSGRSVILDATYPVRVWRAEALAVAKAERATPVIVECHLAPEEVDRRLALREIDPTAVSDANREIARRLRATYEPVASTEASLVLPVTTDRPAPTIAADLAHSPLAPFASG